MAIGTQPPPEPPSRAGDYEGLRRRLIKGEQKQADGTGAAHRADIAVGGVV